MKSLTEVIRTYLKDPLDELPNGIAEALNRNGYVVLPDLADKSWLDEVRLHFDYLIRTEGENAAREHHQEEKANRLANLVNKGSVYEQAWCHPLVLACCAHMFKRPFKLSSLNGREAVPGGGVQPLHSDWKGARGPVNRVHSCNGIWAIDDLTLTNGAPRLVPGSHLFPGRPEELPDEPVAPHPDQIVAEVPAGSVLMFNAHTWHGGTTNQSGERRRVLHAYYTAREHPQWRIPGVLSTFDKACPGSDDRCGKDICS